jgi:3-methylfumaryl-CoA hydratase
MTTPATPDLDIENLRSWIGREEVADDVLTPALAQKYHATFDAPGPAPAEGQAAPRLIHWCLAQPAVPIAGLGADGHPHRGGFLPPVPLPRRMWAGGAVTFEGDLAVGDAVRRVSRIADISLKQGRTGRLCFVTVEHRIETGGRTIVRERQDIVYRDLDAPGAPKKELPPAATGAPQRHIEPHATFLFRYSALTFNGHRIHYDRRHAVETEGYDGLVVHGPLQAALMLNFAADLKGAQPSRISFRGVSPLTDIAPFFVHADKADGVAMKLWTARENGPVAMSAEAEWA